MNNTAAPKFIESPFFAVGDDGWYLLPGAPPDVREEFEGYMKMQEEAISRGEAL